MRERGKCPDLPEKTFGLEQDVFTSDDVDGRLELGDLCIVVSGQSEGSRILLDR